LGLAVFAPAPARDGDREPGEETVIGSIKDKLWQKLEEKDVALAMIYSRDGTILWHRGREITGSTIEDGSGFSKSLTRRSIAESRGLECESDIFEASGSGLPQSVGFLNVQSIIIQQIGKELFLYVDSGRSGPFNAAERDVFRFAGEILSDLVGTEPPTAGESPTQARLRKQIERFALVDLKKKAILVTGETGAGKNYVARRIHDLLRPGRRFEHVHTPAVSQTMFKSELYGHRKRTFTEVDEMKGAVQLAEGGTLFLDEIGDVPLAIQGALLRFLDDRMYRVIGEDSDRVADVCLVVATRRYLREEVEEGRFREDLYYRLNELKIEVPPLRERKGEIPAILDAHGSDWMLDRKPGPGFYDALSDYDWPGNIRELRNVVTRAAVDCEGNTIGAEVREYFGEAPRPRDARAADPIEEIRHRIQAGASFWDAAWRAFIKDRDLNRAQLTTFLERSFLENGSKLKKLCEALNIRKEDEGRFVSALHKYGIHPDPRLRKAWT
jgi:DNA-binding NtrC family response regulator